MKQLFAIFSAIVLLPSFTSHAWIGGPFSNNSYFGENGDDGVYEAVATTSNGVGIFRWGVGNDFPGLQAGQGASSTTSVRDIFGNVITTTIIDPVSSNVFFGGIGRISHSWFLEGVSYSGSCFGSVNSGVGFISCVGTAINAATRDLADNISSTFTAKFDNSGEGLPVSRFSGSGSAQANTATTTGRRFRFTAFGSKVNNQITFGS